MALVRSEKDAKVVNINSVKKGDYILITPLRNSLTGYDEEYSVWAIAIGDENDGCIEGMFAIKLQTGEHVGEKELYQILEIIPNRYAIVDITDTRKGCA